MKRFKNCYKIAMLFFTVLSYPFVANSQNQNKFSSKQIQNLIDADSLESAEDELRTQANFYIQSKQFDSLSNLTYFYGRIAKLKGEPNPIQQAEIALERLKNLTNNVDALYNAYSDMASLYFENQLYEASYKYNQLGLEMAKKTTDDRLNKMAKRTYGLSTCVYYMRKFDLVKKHGIEAFKINQKNPKASATNIYSASNVVGIMLQNENKLDSALYYYSIGVKALEKSKGTLSERYYYPAILSGNMAIIYMNQGAYFKSLKTQQKAIHNYKVFIDSSANSPNIDNIRYNYLSVINDMGSNYVKLGQVERALQIFEYNYKKAKDYFPDNSIQQIIYINQLAQGKWVANENEDALKLINEAYEKFKKLSSDYASYMTYSLGTKANILENFNRPAEAYKAYKESDSLYEIVSPGKYSFDRLTKLREAAMFYSRNGYTDEANHTAQKVLKVVKENEVKETLETIKAYNLIAAIKLNLKDYDESIDWSNKSIKALEKISLSTNMDASFWQELKTETVYYKSKAEYNLIDTTNVKAVSKIHQTIKRSVEKLNTNASKYDSDLDKNEYLNKTRGMLDFSMQTALQLYNLTNEKSYLDYLISIHESRIYNRIRSKLAIREDLQFKDVPTDILKREQQLKDSLALIRKVTDFDKATAQRFTLKNKEWNSFLDSLKVNQPKYYKLRYETIKQSLGNIQSNIPKQTTVIRYFFVGNQLHAFVVNTNKSSLHLLEANNLSDKISVLSESILDEERAKTILFELYHNLWKPFENEVITKKVIIIPDRELFNLSFESLTPKKIETFSDLSKNSLLSEHIISYNYSLYLLDKDKKSKNYANDFIAFAPEFNNEMKENYKIGITDSVNVDQTYMKLLPQPFTVDLAKEYSELFNGASFLNEKASKKIFTSEAKEHKIIHIGTHAESNNVSPELSRLIFAKDANGDDNSLYTFEIYNENLSSNLAILTACETGKPSFRTGEGMISLAHAFNYAGSESILTSLWKIDEQSSAQIIDIFYGYLKDGLPKDEALQQAKLDYIAKAQGRTISPQYWAGLVLIGDTAPIALKTNSDLAFILILASLVLLIIFILVRKLKSNKKLS